MRPTSASPVPPVPAGSDRVFGNAEGGKAVPVRIAKGGSPRAANIIRRCQISSLQRTQLPE
jgi:hypothetical protein